MEEEQVGTPYNYFVKAKWWIAFKEVSGIWQTDSNTEVKTALKNKDKDR